MPFIQWPATPTPAANIAKGQVYLFPFPKPIGVHPAIVVSADLPGQDVTIAYVTDLKKVTEPDGRMKFPWHAKLLPAECAGPHGLDKPSAAKMERIFTVSRDKLWQEFYLGQMDRDALARMDIAIVWAFDLHPFMTEFVLKAMVDAMQGYRGAFSWPG